MQVSPERYKSRCIGHPHRRVYNTIREAVSNRDVTREVTLGNFDSRLIEIIPILD